MERGLPEPNVEYLLEDDATSDPLAAFDVARPNGLQEGLSQPVAILLEEPREIEEIANQAGYRFFRTVEEFKSYVLTELLAEPETVRGRGRRTTRVSLGGTTQGRQL